MRRRKEFPFDTCPVLALTASVPAAQKVFRDQLYTSQDHIASIVRSDKRRKTNIGLCRDLFDQLSFGVADFYLNYY